jgi:membrane associated rhomboid family serine protease
MPEAQPFASCSACGKQAPRDDMFGAEPDLLCEACSEQVRQRLAPRPAGRMVSAFAGKPTPLTAGVLAISAFLFAAELFTGSKGIPDWLWMLWPYGPTGSIGSGQAWRLVSSALIHGGFLHIIFNSMWIWSLGRAVETTRGSLGFLLIFLGSAALSSGAQWYFVAQPIPGHPWAYMGAGVGLSGVLYALAGYLWMRRKVDHIAALVLNPQTAQILGIWFVICIVLPGMRIANWAHGGGLVWGLAAGWASTQPPKIRYPAFAALALVTIAAVAVVSTGHRAH